MSAWNTAFPSMLTLTITGEQDFPDKPLTGSVEINNIAERFIKEVRNAGNE
jgi:hypothetical protein